jgi:hypothetical protein
MNVGDLIYDSALGLKGIIVEKNIFDHGSHTVHTDRWDFLILYEDGDTWGADTAELEVLSESR